MSQIVRWAHVTPAALALGAVFAVNASAASAASSIAVSFPAQPVEGLPFTVRVHGTTDNTGPYQRDASVSFFRRGVQCDPFRTADLEWAWTGIPGGTAYSRSHTFGKDSALPRGQYVACAWLNDYNETNTTAASNSLLFSVREAHYSLKLKAPAHERASDPSPGGVRRPTKYYRATTDAEAPGGELTVEVQERGVHKCARTPDGSKGQLGYTGLDGKKVQTGDRTYKRKGEVFEVGTFLVCGWIVDAMGHTVARAHTKVTVRH
jgi:hypothetical protein